MNALSGLALALGWTLTVLRLLLQEGKILHFDHATKQVEMELLSSQHGKTSTGGLLV